jgi:hypothetical protein
MIQSIRKKYHFFIFDISVELEHDRGFDIGKMTVYFDRMISQLFA